MGDEPTEEMRDAVRGITGQELEIEGSRRLDFIIGIRSYSHNFVVAPFSMKKDGIIGLDLLNKLNASINIPAREINLDGHTIKLKNHQQDRVKRVSQRQPRVCKMDPRQRENKYERVEAITESNRGSQRPVTERVEETPTKPSRAESLAESEQVERLQ
jgi:hypothetical protein